MASRKCTHCGHQGVDVDDERRCHFCRADTASPTSSRHMHALLAALGKRAPAVDKATRDQTKQDARQRAYTATPEQLGCSTVREVWEAIGRGDINGETAEGFDRLMRALAIVRAVRFGHEVAQYMATDCPFVRSATKAGRTAEELARAITAASKDPWFAKRKTITFRELVEKAPALLAAPSAAANTRVDEKARAIAACQRDIDLLKEHSAVDGAEMDIALEVLSLEAIATHHARVKQGLARWTR